MPETKSISGTITANRMPHPFFEGKALGTRLYYREAVGYHTTPESEMGVNISIYIK